MAPSEVYKPPVPQNQVVPPVLPEDIPPATVPVPEPVPAAPSMHPSVEKKPTSRKTCLVIGGLIAAIVVVVIGFTAGFYLISNFDIQWTDLPAAETVKTENLPQKEPAPIESVEVKKESIQPGSEMHTDSEGVGFQLPPQEGKGTQAVDLVSTRLGTALTQPFEDQYSIESLAYSVSVSGDGDTPRRGVLEFPAKSPDDRLAVVVDGKYIGILSILPENGKLTIQPRVDLENADPDHNPEGVNLKYKQYVVVRPKQSNKVSPEQSLHTQSSGGLQSPLSEDDITSCFTMVHSHCYRNAESTIYIFSDKKTNLVYPFTDILAYSKKVTDFYYKDKFFGREPSSYDPIYIIIGGNEAPVYSIYNGNIYFPLDSLNNSSSLETQYALAHELFHWVEDYKYVMAAGAIDNKSSWWLEMAAEYAAFLVNPQFINLNLQHYGEASMGETIGFQLEPFMWQTKEEARYIHAQSLLVGICKGNPGCIFDEDNFKVSITYGWYPFESGDTISRYQKNSIDVARYVLGEAPQQSNNGVTIPEIAKTGKGLGEYIHGMTKGSGSQIITSPSPQNFKKSGNSVEINAKIPPGDVYPLRISDGANSPINEMGSSAGAPITFLVEGNQNYFAKVGKDGLIDGNGKGQMMFGPIHDKMGLEIVRIAAYSQEQPTIFKAKVDVLDLSGDWVGTLDRLISQSQTCPSKDGESSGNFSTAAPDPVLNVLSAYGQFVRDPADASGKTLNWEQSTPLPAAVNVTVEAKATLENDKIKMNWKVNIPKQTSSLEMGPFASLLPGERHEQASYPWGWLTVPGLAICVFIPLKKHRKETTVLLIAMIIAIPIFSSGCGVKTMYGTISGEHEFEKVEYPEKDYSYPPKNNVFWNLSKGTGSITYDVFAEVFKDFTDSSKGYDIQECITKISYSLSGKVQKDGLITPANLNTSSK